MIARVIPAVRTPRHIDAFDYLLPDNPEIVTGDLVTIPFRRASVAGLVREIVERPSTDAPLKPLIARYGDIRLTKDTLAILDALAARSFCAPPNVLHAWIGTLPKKPKKDKTNPRQLRNERLRSSRLMADHVSGTGGVIETARELISKGFKTLIISPWAARADMIASRLKTDALTSDRAMGRRYECWSRFVRNETPILVATRLGAWLAAEADIMILDEPENDDHRQDELSPRYDARWIAEAAHRMGRGLMTIGTTPTLRALHRRDVARPDIPAITCDLRTIDVHRVDWSPIPTIQHRTLTHMEAARDEQRALIVIHPIHGDRARLCCADCGWQALCAQCGSGMHVRNGALVCLRCNAVANMHLSCPVCGSSDLSRAKAGRDRLRNDLAANGFAAAVVHSLTSWNALNQIPDRATVVLTDLSLLSGGAEDLRKKERLIIAFRRLADACASSALVVQGDAGLCSEAKQWLEPDGCYDALAHELQERRSFGLPPVTRLLKMIFRGNEGHASRNLEIIRSRTGNAPSLTVSGPYPVLHRPSHRSERWIGHLIMPVETPAERILSVVEPLLSTDTILDLDPIAFFE